MWVDMFSRRRALLIAGIASVLYIRGLPIQVIYVLWPVLLFLSLQFIFSHKINIRIQGLFVFLLLYIFVSAALQIYLGAHSGSVLNFSLSWSMLIVGFCLSYGLSFDSIDSIFSRIGWFSVFYALLDAVWRFLHPDLSQIFDGNALFYRFKSNSLMFEDSNFVGVMLVCVNSMLLVICELKNKKNIYLLGMLFMAIILTFSRASIMAALFTYGVMFFYNSRRSIKFFTLISGVMLSFYFFSLLYADGSFRSKFYIIDSFESVFYTFDFIRKLIGVGLGNTFEFLGIGAHSIVVVGFFELGAFCFLIYLLIVLLLISLCGISQVYLFVPYLLNGFSLTSTSVPILFLSSGVVLSIYYGKKRASSER
ncbi:hypothetical protein NMD15_00550 [Plesiomonas shigelloides]|uniref:hypothetical protein n=1 Tax=Plesiomonas shigelloides TaxID=703 RepID=UPI00351D1043